MFILFCSLVRTIGRITMGIAIEKSCLVTRGKIVRRHVLPWTQIFPAYTAKKKTYLFKVYTVVLNRGWVCLIIPPKVRSFGAMRPL